MVEIKIDEKRRLKYELASHLITIELYDDGEEWVCQDFLFRLTSDRSEVPDSFTAVSVNSGQETWTQKFDSLDDYRAVYNRVLVQGWNLGVMELEQLQGLTYAIAHFMDDSPVCLDISALPEHLRHLIPR